MARTRDNIASRAPTQRLEKERAAKTAPTSSTTLRALETKPRVGGSYSVTAKPARAAEPPPLPVTVVAVDNGMVQLDVDGSTVTLTRREARALAEKLLRAAT